MSRRSPAPSPGHEVTCRQAVALVTDYLDGVLSAADQARFEAHLSECTACTEHVKQIRVTVAVSGHIREDELDPAAREDLMGLYRRWLADRHV